MRDILSDKRPAIVFYDQIIVGAGIIPAKL